jgi:hypothetical protein
MKEILFFLTIILAGCQVGERQSQTSATTDPADTIVQTRKKETVTPAPAKVFANERFKEVTVENTGEHQFLIRGKAQIFEASFNWVVEDGHEELKSGFQTTDAGAPEWGNFSFTVDVQKKRTNSSLHVILFESSAKDGSRQYELPVFLY